MVEVGFFFRYVALRGCVKKLSDFILTLYSHFQPVDGSRCQFCFLKLSSFLFYAVHSGTVSKSLCVLLILSLFLCQSVTQNQLGAVVRLHCSFSLFVFWLSFYNISLLFFSQK